MCSTEHIQSSIKKQFPVLVSGRNLEAQAAEPLCDVEQNALRYVASYIIRRVYEKIESRSMSHPNKNQMLDLLLSFFDEEINDATTISQGCSWMLMTNRGGLCQVTNQTYGVFLKIEIEIRKHLKLFPNHDAVLKSTVEDQPSSSS